MVQSGLIGYSGFVGSILSEEMHFDKVYNSKNISEIKGQEFDLLVCAGAPAVMWAANKNPDKDAANLDSIITSIGSAKVKTLVLISTVAVFEDYAAGFTETNAKFETEKAYGKNRRSLELQAANIAEHVLILRLPALIGRGLKKNFIFDLMNPVPSFLKPDIFTDLKTKFTGSEVKVVDALFTYDEKLEMWAFDRQKAKIHPEYSVLEAGFKRNDFMSRMFTNSQSSFQYYNVERLHQDIQTCLDHNLTEMNICSAPMTAGEVHELLIGEPYQNTGPAQFNEDVRTEHAAAFGKTGPYLFDKAEVISELTQFFKRETA